MPPNKQLQRTVTCHRPVTHQTRHWDTPAGALEKAINDGQLLASTATLRELIERVFSAKF